jgi:hypothetical protein
MTKTENLSSQTSVQLPLSSSKQTSVGAEPSSSLYQPPFRNERGHESKTENLSSQVSAQILLSFLKQTGAGRDRASFPLKGPLQEQEEARIKIKNPAPSFLLLASFLSIAEASLAQDKRQEN